MNETKNFTNVEMSWATLLKQLGPQGNDFKMFGIRPRADAKYFNARTAGEQIVIDIAKVHSNSSEINVDRHISFKEFKCVAGKYNDYVSGVKGTREQMRDECGQNTSYLISLIHYLL
ncbi:hypothetical protein [Methanolobus sp.]|uniref:hypothetical protein n=1 Tax=Methanolobus sp. TaxID=1874737 RepID=UPI0025F0275A|nr:hypothetical protein [Methanolobus sp.]